MCRKRRFHPGLLGQGHLPISASQVQGREPLFTGQHIQGIINSWQRVGILHSNIVEAAVVNTKPGTPILFRHEDDRRRPRAVTGLDLPTGQHLSNTFLLLFHLLRGHPTRRTAYGRTIIGVNFVFYCITMTGESRPWGRKQSKYCSRTSAARRRC